MPPMRARAVRLASVGTLAVIAFVLAHQLVFVFTYGPDSGAGLVRTGHGTDWATTVTVAILLAAALLVAGSIELARLARRAGGPRRERPGGGAGGVTIVPAGRPMSALGMSVARLWAIVFILSLGLFAIAENAEHLAAHLPLPGLGVLGDAEYSATIPVFLYVSLLVAFVAAVFRWRRETLLARLRLQPVAFDRPRRDLDTGLVGDDRRPESHLGRRMAGRAPPQRAGVLVPAR